MSFVPGVIGILFFLFEFFSDQVLAFMVRLDWFSLPSALYRVD